RQPRAPHAGAEPRGGAREARGAPAPCGPTPEDAASDAAARRRAGEAARVEEAPRRGEGGKTEGMNRRQFLITAGTGVAGVTLGGRAAVPGSGVVSGAAGVDTAADSGTSDPRWRTFEVTTSVEVLQASNTTRVWLPTPLAAAPYQQTAGDTYHAVGGRTVMIETGENDPDILAAVWEDGNPAVLTLTSRVATRDHAIDLTAPDVPPPRDLSAFGRFLRPTRFIPTDGIVKKTADAITRGAGTDLERARALYE